MTFFSLIFGVFGLTAPFSLTAREKTLSTDQEDIQRAQSPIPNLKDAAKIQFWIGSAGLLSSIFFNNINVPPARTASYLVWGGAWSAWLGSYGQAKMLEQGNGLDHLDSGASNGSANRCLGLSLSHCQASTQGTIGEMSNLHLIPDGVYFHPIYNDVNGNTDKLLTASAKIGMLKTFGQLGVETVAFWRLLTPSFAPEFEAKPLETPVGRYADWAEWKNTVSYSYGISGIGARSQISLGYSDVGNKGGRELHREFHILTHNRVDHLEYTDQPDGRFFTVAAEQGISGRITAPVGHTIETLVNLQTETSRFMNEVGGMINLRQEIYPEFWEQALEIRIVRQIGSEVYTNIKPWRYEVSYGARIFKHFTPSVKHVSSYLLGDNIGQTYVDILHYNWEF